MNKPGYHAFWSKFSPLSCLSGAALLLMASDRLAHAITAAGALVWVYCLSSLTACFGVKIFPRHGKLILLAFLTSFFAGNYLLLLWILSPLCAMELFFVISFIPMFCTVSEIFKQLDSRTLSDTLFASFSEALLFGVLIIIFALIREPFGFLSLSLPGGTRGILLLFSFKSESFLPVRLITSSCGALLLLGYLLGLYRYLGAKYAPQEGKE